MDARVLTRYLLERGRATAKRKAQPWQCEVTLIPQARRGAGRRRRQRRPPKRRAAAQAATFACDEPE